MNRIEEYALIKRVEALGRAVEGLIQQQRVLAALPEIVNDQVKLSDLRWNLVMAAASGDSTAIEKAKRELTEHADRVIAKNYRSAMNG